MNYEVLWKPAAEQQLADLWMNAADGNVVTAAADALDVYGRAHRCRVFS